MVRIRSNEKQGGGRPVGSGEVVMCLRGKGGGSERMVRQQGTTGLGDFVVELSLYEKS